MAKQKSAKKLRTGAHEFSSVLLHDALDTPEAGPSFEFSNVGWDTTGEAREAQSQPVGRINYDIANCLVKDAVHENVVLRREVSSLKSQNERDTLMWQEQ